MNQFVGILAIIMVVLLYFENGQIRVGWQVQTSNQNQ